MKTTIDIADAVFTEAQKLAAKEETTLKALVNEALRKLLRDRQIRTPFQLKDGSFKGGNGFQPDFENASWAEIRAASYGLPPD
jgi:hypothetical protein